MYPNQFDHIGDFHGDAKLHLKENVEPYIDAPRKWPIHLKDKIKTELENMEQQSIIRRVEEHTDWCSSLAFSTKSDGSIRICLDPSKLNKALKRCKHKIPTVEELNHRLDKAKYFSKLDAKAGYWSIHLDPASQLLTTFRTPFGRYCFLRLPFGLSVSQDIFQQRMDSILEKCGGVIGIADDVAVFGQTEQEHDKHLHQLMEIAEKQGLVFNSKKCFIKQKQISFYGMLYSGEGIHPDPKKVSDIHNMPTPTCKRELQEFLGLIQYLSAFIQNLSEKAAPLRELLKTDIRFLWESDHQHCYDELKKLVSADATLQYYDVNSPTILQTDASLKGLGAALMQPDKSGRERPIAYASKLLSDAETRYANIERELLAVCFGIKRFRTFTYGRHFTVITDHKPLVMILNKNLTSAPARLQRMILDLQGYDFTIEYRPGKEIPLPDLLSRLPNPENKKHIDSDVRVDMLQFSKNKLSKIQEATRDDVILSQLTKVILEGWPETMKELPNQIRDYWSYRDELSVENGIILKGERVLIPDSLRAGILEQLHTGHLGIEKTRLHSKISVYWPKINSDIEQMCKVCSTCQQYKNSQPHETLLQHEIPTGPWETVGTDLFSIENHNYLIIVDYYSKYPVVKRLPEPSPSSVVIAITKQVFAEHGIPTKVVSDNGPHFASTQYRDFAKTWDFKHVTSSPHYPRSNGFVERQIQTIKHVIKKTKQAGEDIEMGLLSLRATPVDNKLPSPAELLFQRRVRANLPCHIQNKNSNRDQVYEQLQQRQNNQKFYHDRSAKDLPLLRQGAQVTIQDPATGKWNPGIVKDRCHEPRSYQIENENGNVVRRNRQQIRSTEQTILEDMDTPKTIDTEDSPKSTENSEAIVTQATPYKTRSGRLVQKPRRLSQYVD